MFTGRLGLRTFGGGDVGFIGPIDAGPHVFVEVCPTERGMIA